MKRNVFSCLLKEAREVAVVTLVGRLFHARATVTWKDRSQYAVWQTFINSVIKFLVQHLEKFSVAVFV